MTPLNDSILSIMQVDAHAWAKQSKTAAEHRALSRSIRPRTVVNSGWHAEFKPDGTPYASCGFFVADIVGRALQCGPLVGPLFWHVATIAIFADGQSSDRANAVRKAVPQLTVRRIPLDQAQAGDVFTTQGETHIGFVLAAVGHGTLFVCFDQNGTVRSSDMRTVRSECIGVSIRSSAPGVSLAGADPVGAVYRMYVS